MESRSWISLRLVIGRLRPLASSGQHLIVRAWILLDKPKTLHREPDDRADLHRIYPYLLRGMAITRPNQVRCAEIVYIPVQYGFLYLVAIMTGPRAMCSTGGSRTTWILASASRR